VSPPIRGLTAAKKFGIIVERERKKKKMKIPKSSTIRSKIHAYAKKADMTIMHNLDGTYNVWSNVIGYHTHKNVNMDTVVRVVVDELYAMEFRKNPSMVSVS